MTEQLFDQDAYLTHCEARVINVTERGGIILDQTVFYPTGGGQPGDSGLLKFDGGQVVIATTVKDRESGELVHVASEGQRLPSVGDKVTAEIDWSRRHRHMRMHTALHLLCAIVPCGVTGGQIGEQKSRLDFDVGETTLDKAAIEASLNQLVSESHAVSNRWISDQELAANPDLVRTMSVKPPRGAGKVRLLAIGDDVDLQPCGGTHVNNSSEIGQLRLGKIENKGKRNRRVNILLVD